MLFQVTMFPTDKRGDSVSKEVSRVINMIDKSGLSYKLTAMVTIIEGEWDEVMNLLNRARKMLRRNHDRIYISIVIDDRKKARNQLIGKVKSIESHLGREVAK